MRKPKILSITPVKHIKGLCEILEITGEVIYLEDPSLEEVINKVGDCDAIFTNPNKSKVFIGQEILDAAEALKVICTASTGTNHIDKQYAKDKKIPILSLTEERAVINKISSTAELAFSLMMSGLRHVVRSHNNALQGEWNYENYIGRQMNYLTIGVIGYGRLGSMFANYCRAFGSNVLVYDPYKSVENEYYEQVANLDLLAKKSDVIAIHVHVSNETVNMVDEQFLKKVKNDVLIVNTSRGDMVNEKDIVSFLKMNPKAKIATDVLADEVRNKVNSPLLKYAKESEQVTITQHIGGMTMEAQEIAYCHAAKMMKNFFN
ncbi:hypothetical protein JCM14469_19800 [Desulfatiferula olefinivorans]